MMRIFKEKNKRKDTSIPFPIIDPPEYGGGPDICNGLYGLPPERRLP
jgi:hypothetical protein